MEKVKGYPNVIELSTVEIQQVWKIIDLYLTPEAVSNHFKFYDPKGSSSFEEFQEYHTYKFCNTQATPLLYKLNCLLKDLV